MELFGTAGIRGRVGERLTPSLALEVGRAVGVDADAVVLGRDGRTTGAGLGAAVEAGVVSGGADVVCVGQVPTPALAHASRGCHGVMVTASHNPPADNGLKLFVDGREYDTAREREIERRVETSPDPAPWDEWGERRQSETVPDYRDAVGEYAENHGAALGELGVVVDCGNGTGGVVVPQVLRDLGADVRALEANVDGRFPARESKPTSESLRHLRAFVSDGDAALGLGLDGDADRIVVVDGEGSVVHEDTVVAILAGYYVERAGCEDPVVVTTPNASTRIDEAVQRAGGRVERVRLGALHEGIASVRADGGAGTEVVFAAEPWKHVHPGLGDWIDGVASAAVIARLVAAEGLATLCDPIEERPYRKRNVACPDESKDAATSLVDERLPAAVPEAAIDREHGLRLTLPDGSWVLVRPSGTEPYLRVYAESEDVDALVDRVLEVVEGAVEDA